MNFSWKQFVVPAITGLMVTSCATTDDEATAARNTILGSRGLVPAPMEEPSYPTSYRNNTSCPNVNTTPAFTNTENTDNTPVIGKPAPLDNNATLVTDATKAPTVAEPVMVKPNPWVGKTTKYIVKKNDALSIIAMRYGMTTKELAELNDIKTTSIIRIGQVLEVPANVTPRNISPKKTSSAKSSSATSNKTKATSQMPKDGKYTVKSGDSLWLIARRFGLKSSDIRSANNLTSDKLRIGQVLVLHKDSSINSIAAPKVVNTLPVAVRNPEVKVKEIVTPAIDAPAPTPAPVVPPVVVDEKVSEAITIASDEIVFDELTCDGVNTIEGISELYGVSIDEIKKHNPNINLNDLKNGTTLKIPLTN